MSQTTSVKNLDYTTDVVRLSYCNFAVPQPRERKNPASEKLYGCQVIFDPGAGLDDMYRAVCHAADLFFTDQYGPGSAKMAAGALHNPLRSGAGKPDKPELQGKWFLNCSSKQQPIIVDIDGKSQIPPAMFKSGYHGRLNVNLFKIDRPEKKGVGVGLNGVQFVRIDEVLGGSGGPSLAGTQAAFAAKGAVQGASFAQQAGQANGFGQAQPQGFQPPQQGFGQAGPAQAHPGAFASPQQGFGQQPPQQTFQPPQQGFGQQPPAQQFQQPPQQGFGQQPPQQFQPPAQPMQQSPQQNWQQQPPMQQPAPEQQWQQPPAQQFQPPAQPVTHQPQQNWQQPPAQQFQPPAQPMQQPGQFQPPQTMQQQAAWGQQPPSGPPGLPGFGQPQSPAPVAGTYPPPG